MVIKKNYIFIIFILCFVSVSTLWGQLSSVTVVPTSLEAGKASIHNVTFTLGDTIPADGQIRITYPAGFDLQTVQIVLSSTMDGSFGLTPNNNELLITRSGGSEQINGETETLQLINVTNQTTIGSSYQATIQTYDGTGTLIEAGTSSNFTVTAGPLSYFTISDPGSVTAGTNFSATISSFDVYGNAVNLTNESLSLSINQGILTPATTNMTGSSLVVNNLNIELAQSGAQITVTGGGKQGISPTFTIQPDVLDYVHIIEGPSGDGTSLDTRSLTADQTLYLHAAGYDQYNNYISDTQCTWTSTGDIRPVANRVATSIEFSPTTATVAGVVGTFQATPTDPTATGDVTGNITVTVGAEDHIKILDGASGNTSEIGQQGLTAGQTLTVHASNFDSDDNYIGDVIVDWSVSGGIGNLSDVNSVSTTLTATTQGDGHIRAYYGSLSEEDFTDQINVNAGNLNYILVIEGPSGDGTPLGSRAMTADEVLTVHAAGYDANDNYLGDYSVTWGSSGSLAPSINTTGSSFTFSPTTAPASGRIRAIHATAADDSTGLITISVGTADHIKILANGTGNTSEVDLQGLTAAQTLTVHASSFDADDNYVGDVSVTWDITSAIGDLSENSGVSTTFTATTPGTGTIYAQHGSLGEDGTGIITVIEGSISYILIIEGPSGDGTQLDTWNMDADESLTVHAAGYDVLDNYLGDVSVTWSSNNLSPVISGSGQSFTFNPTLISTNGRINAEYSPIITDATGIITVTYGKLDHYSLATVPNRKAGKQFYIDLQAEDSDGNIVENFNQSVQITDETGTISPTTSGNFTNGVWADSGYVTQSWTDNTITVLGSNKSGTSNNFHIYSRPTNAFFIKQIQGPKVASDTFSIRIEAQDIYGNRVLGFNNRTVTISDLTGTIFPTNSGNFVNGYRREVVQIQQSQNDVSITVQDDSSRTGISNLFNVEPNAVNHFLVREEGTHTISNQVKGVSFPVEIIAQDADSNRATSFTGTVLISDQTGTIEPTISGNFQDGKWVGNLTVKDTLTQNWIQVTRSGSSETGVSDTFSVADMPGIRITEFFPSQNSVTAGQAQNWNLILLVQNQMGRAAQFDSLNLLYQLNTQAQADYLQLPITGFQISQNTTLGANSTDTLIVSIDTTGQGLGDVSIRADIYLTDSGTGRTLTDDELTGIRVQDSARVSITKIIPSMTEVTRNQIEEWQIQMVIENSGGSEIQMDSTALDTAVNFSIPGNWAYTKSQGFLNSGNWNLQGSTTDTIEFIMVQTSNGPAGTCTIHGFIGFTELNTLRIAYENTRDANSIQIALEDSAKLVITNIENLAVNDLGRHEVNTNQTFKVRATIENTGGDGCHDIDVSLESNGGYSAIIPSVIHIDALDKYSQTTVDFNLKASGQPNEKEIFRAQVEGYSDNINSYVFENSPSEDTTAVRIQRRSHLKVTNIIAMVDTVNGEQKDPWQIKVAVANEHIDQFDTERNRTTLKLNKPQASDLSFIIQDETWNDYIVTPPTAFNESRSLYLAGGQTDTLTYTVTSTGSYGGSLNIEANLTGQDTNNDSTRVGQGVSTNTVHVISDPKLRILSTSIVTPNTTESGNGYVNTDGLFSIPVVVENGLSQTLENIAVYCYTNGQSTFSSDTILYISRLTLNERDTVSFTIRADNIPNLQGELFTASVISARIAGTSINVDVGKAIDSTATVFIQTPARLSVSLSLTPETGILTTNQVFQLKASLINTGSSQVDTTGEVRIELPDDYIVTSGNELASIFENQDAVWYIQAPSVAKISSEVDVRISTVPLEKNTGQPATVVSWDARVFVETIASLLAAELSIDSPDGAKDDTLSTGQTFNLKSTFTSNNVQDIRATLILPTGFKTQDDLEKGVINNEVLWQITCPDAETVTPQNILVECTGKDSLDGSRTVDGLSGIISLNVVEKANLSFSLDLSIEDGSATLGQIFQVFASVENLGHAATVGNTEITIGSLPDGYQLVPLNTPRTLSLAPDQTDSSWTVQAPNYLTKQAVNISASITKIPDDENTNTSAYVSRSEQSVAVTTVGTWVSISSYSELSNAKGLFVPGDKDVFLMGLCFVNRGEKGANSVQIRSLKFDIEDRVGEELVPNAFLNQVKAVKINIHNDTSYVVMETLYGVLSGSEIPGQNPVTLQFDQLGKTLVAEDTAYIAILGSISDQAESQYLQLNMKNMSYIQVSDLDHPEISIPVWNSTGQEFSDLISAPKQIISEAIATSDQTQYLINCPNPFGSPGKEQTTFIYYLPEEMDVTFSIFTLLGELVWRREFTQNDQQGSAGLHNGDLLWDATNDRGYKVLNGVYLLIMKTGNNKISKRKIAVVK